MLSPIKTTTIGTILVLGAVLASGLAGCDKDKKLPPQLPAPPSPQAQQTGPDYEQMRAEMVKQLQEQGMVQSQAVIAAMKATRRHLFVLGQVRHLAYYDTPLPIGEDQTISAPGVVAKMTELLDPQTEDIVLEVGTGSGYQAAVLAHLVKHVYTIEILAPLAESAEERLKQLGYDNVTVRCGDGYQGWPEHAPFDGIIVTCAPEEVPQPLQDQLAEGGRMVIPVGPEHGVQDLYLLEKQAGAINTTAVLPVRFVPMTGEAEQH